MHTERSRIYEDEIYNNYIYKGKKHITREKLMELDSNNISISGAIELLDFYFEEKAITQFERESEDIKQWMLMEFAKQFNGEDGRMKISQKIDQDIIKAINILDDPFVYREAFIQP